MEVQVAPSFFKSLKRMTGIGHIYRELRSWIYYHTRRTWFHLLHEVLHSYPYDHSYLLRLEQAKLKEMIAYHEKTRRFIDVEYVIRDMKIAVALLDIILENRKLFHFNGELTFEEIEGSDDVEVGNTDDFEYVCDVKVNTHNIGRFVPKGQQDIFLKMPHELYIKKAKALYYKIRYEKTDYWWD